MAPSVSETPLTARRDVPDPPAGRSPAAAIEGRPAEQPDDAPPTMELRRVVKSYGGAPAVDDISLALARGEFLTLLGPSGCGKTTLLNMIAGFFPPTSGEIWIAGRDVTSLAPYQRNTGVVFQNYALFPHMTVEQNVAFGLVERRIGRAGIRQRVAEALRMVKLADFGGRRPAQLSGGQQQRVALARALVIKPQVLLLDEPLSALDKNLRSHMQIELKQIQKQARVATVFVTHDQAEALSLSDRIVVMNKGKIEQIGSPQEIYRYPQSSFVASFVGEVSRIRGAVLRASPEATVISIANGLQLQLAARHRGLFAPGDQVELFVRPENIAITVGDTNRGDLIPGRIVARSYQGSHTQVVVEVDGLGTILVTVPGNELTGTLAASTEDIWLQVELAHASVMPA
jgi:spermidine/putrescine ABC transporter ATP-binding subunit